MSVVLTVALAFALVVLPGWAIATLVGLRWRDALAAAASVTAALAAVGAALSEEFGLSWGPTLASILVAAALGCALAVSAVRFFVRRRKQQEGLAGKSVRGSLRLPKLSTTDLVVAVLAVIPAIHFSIASRGLKSIPEGWDAIFHGAATRFIADTGQGGLTALSPVSQPANPDFYYPNTYHLLSALLIQISGISVPTALNALSALTGMIFVLGIAVLAGRLTSGSRWATIGAAAAAAGAWPMPYAILSHGPLLPFALGLALIPGLLLMGERLTSGVGNRWPAAVLLGIGVAGAWSVHPSIVFAAAIPLLGQAISGLIAVRGWRSRCVLLGAGLVAMAPAGAYVLWSLTVLPENTAEGLATFSWPRTTAIGVVLARLLDLGPTPLASIALGAATVLGLAVALVRPTLGGSSRRALVGPLIAFFAYGALFVLAAGVSGAWVRRFTGIWWDDASRMIAMLVIPSALLVGIGVQAILPSGSWRRPRVKIAGAAVLAMAILLASAQPSVTDSVRARVYGGGPTVNADERSILETLAEHYTGGREFNDPFDGTSWSYALYSIPAVFPTPLADQPEKQLGRDRMELYTGINRYGLDPAITHIVHHLDVRWIVVGTGVIGGPGRPFGLIGVHLNPNIRLVAQKEGARLYELLPVPAEHRPLPLPPGIPPAPTETQPPNTDSALVVSEGKPG